MARPKKSEKNTELVATNIEEGSDLDNNLDPNNMDDVNFDYKSMTTNFDTVLKDIDVRIKNAETKLTSLAAKEDILNKMIHTTNSKMETTEASNYKLIGTYQNILMKQLESLNMWQESVMRYEDLIQRYIKMRLDIENNKLASFIKIKSLYKANDTVDEGFDALLKNMHNLSTNPSAVFDLQAEAAQQLRIQGY